MCKPIKNTLCSSQCFDSLCKTPTNYRKKEGRGGKGRTGKERQVEGRETQRREGKKKGREEDQTDKPTLGPLFLLHCSLNEPNLLPVRVNFWCEMAGRQSDLL